MIRRNIEALELAAIIAFTVILMSCQKAYAETAPKIDLYKIMMIESSGNPLAHNVKDDSRGLFQITPICLKEYNNFHPKAKHTMDDLWNTSVSTKIASWYINKQLTRYLRCYKIPLTTTNYLIAWHDGIGNLKKYLKGERKLGPEMKGYLVKYENLSKRKNL